MNAPIPMTAYRSMTMPIIAKPKAAGLSVVALKGMRLVKRGLDLGFSLEVATAAALKLEARSKPKQITNFILADMPNVKNSEKMQHMMEIILQHLEAGAAVQLDLRKACRCDNDQIRQATSNLIRDQQIVGRLVGNIKVFALYSRPGDLHGYSRHIANGKPCEFHGVSYPSICAAAEAHKVSEKTIGKWIRDKAARVALSALATRGHKNSQTPSDGADVGPVGQLGGSK